MLLRRVLLPIYDYFRLQLDNGTGRPTKSTQHCAAASPFRLIEEPQSPGLLLRFGKVSWIATYFFCHKESRLLQLPLLFGTSTASAACRFCTSSLQCWDCSRKFRSVLQFFMSATLCYIPLNKFLLRDIRFRSAGNYRVGVFMENSSHIHISNLAFMLA